MTRGDGNHAGKGDNVKKFLNWVNADEDLPNLVELSDEETEEDQHDEEEQDDNEEIEEPEVVQTIDLDALTEGYEGDDEFEYPDEVAFEDPLGEEEIRVGKRISAALQEPLFMSRKQKIQMEKFRFFYLILSAIVAINVIAVLLITTHYLPAFGSAENPAVNEVYIRYIEQGTAETGALNIVAAVLFSYRSFDTLGEAFMLFAAAIGVIILMRKPAASDKAGKDKE